MKAATKLYLQIAVLVVGINMLAWGIVALSPLILYSTSILCGGTVIILTLIPTEKESDDDHWWRRMPE